MICTVPTYVEDFYTILKVDLSPVLLNGFVRISLPDPQITLEADKTYMSPQASQGCEARNGDDGLALARPVPQPPSL